MHGPRQSGVVPAETQNSVKIGNRATLVLPGMPSDAGEEEHRTMIRATRVTNRCQASRTHPTPKKDARSKVRLAELAVTTSRNRGE